MAENYGTGVSRVLDPKESGYRGIIWQADKPPLDSEFTFAAQLAEECDRLQSLQGSPSGWYGDGVNPQASFETQKTWSNWFKFGPQFSGEKGSIMWAMVNGWLVPVTGTLTGTPPGSPNNADTWNRITLPPPPANTGDSRIDFVFLEVWKARIQTAVSTNKPSASAVYRFGNVEGGYSYLPDDLTDPEIAIETTQRIQIQYRIRVVSGLVGLASYPDGFDPSVVKGQGSANAQTAFVFENMRAKLGDPGLWRAGDGTENSLGTVDGYTYAIPLCAVFRRNTVSWSGNPNQNLNGGVNRNPTAVDRTGFKTFSTTPTLLSAISAGAGTLTLVSTANIELPTTPASPVAIKIGDEILYYSAITGSTMTLSSRGSFGTQAEPHPAGSTISILSGRPDGLYSDQITTTDILDLRHIVNPGGFDYQGLLKGGLDRLLRGNLKSTWKRSGGGPQGPFVSYADVITAGAVSLGVTKLDNPDDKRSIFGNPVALQPVILPFPVPTSNGTPTVSLGGSYSLTTSGTGTYAPGSSITVLKTNFTTSVPGADLDQVSLVANQTYVKIRFQGETADLPNSEYSVANDVNGNLVVTLSGSFTVSSTRDANKAFLTLHVLYGAGRGLSRVPNVVHDVVYLESSSEVLVAPQGVPAGNSKLRTAWLPLWSKYRSGVYAGQLPVTAEAYVDPGSGTVVLTPFQRVTSSILFVPTQRSNPTSSLLGVMPRDNNSGVKWNTTDPLEVFQSYSAGSRVVTLPRRMVPGWGAVKAPILYQDQTNFDEGINFMISSPKGVVGNTVTHFSPTVFTGGTNTFAVFSTRNLSVVSPTSIAYNTAATFGSTRYAGLRFFTDSRGMSRKGLELPPFYGITRLWAVYEAEDYRTNGSAYNSSDRERDTGPGTRATNLLRSNFEGDTFWIEIDSDGDSTFILNADALDLSKSPNAISAFANGHYVIESSIFGFDRGFFDLGTDPRLVITREAGNAPASVAPTFVLPWAPKTGDSIEVHYSREPYQGDCWGSQMTQSDIAHTPGAMPTATRHQLLNTVLNYESLDLINPKVLEVVAGMSFYTTLGTGRYTGDGAFGVDADFRNVGYEPWTIPAQPTDPRPTITVRALDNTERTLGIGTLYAGCVERLPLGALFRSKDFRGNSLSPNLDYRQLVTGVWNSPSTLVSNVVVNGNEDYTQDPVAMAPMVSGNSGEVLVHVDGQAGNYTGTTIYRTARGGSVYGISGGDVSAILPQSNASPTSGGVLSGLAMLVRNLPTNIGSNEVSAGGELMLLVVTTANVQTLVGNNNIVLCGAAGSGEGYSSADLYRLPGHPLTNDSARVTKAPTTVKLARKGG